MRKYLANAKPLMLSLIVAFGCTAQEATEAEPIRAVTGQASKSLLQTMAKIELRSFLTQLRRDIKPGTLPDHFPLDVNDLSELNKATIGEGYQVHTVSPDRLMAGGRLEDMVVAQDIWNFFIMVEDQVVGQLSMEKTNGRWQVGRIGSYGIAQSVREAMTQHRSSSDFRFIRIYQATADLMEVGGSDARQYVPLVSARYSLPLPKETRSMGSEDIVNVLQNAVSANMMQN